MWSAGGINGDGCDDLILGARIDSIEIFDLSAVGSQTLKLDRLDVIHLSDDTIMTSNNGVNDTRTTLTVLGGENQNDLLILAKVDATDAWTKSVSTVISNGITFDEYLNGNIRVLAEVGDVGVALNV